MKGHLRPFVGIALAALPLLASLALGCETAPARAFRGARHYSAGSEALVLGENARAIAELERAVELVPGASEVRNHLGLAYWAEGRTDEARRAFEVALELDCENGAARQNLETLSRLEAGEPSSVARLGVDAPGAPGGPPVNEGGDDGR